MINSWKLAILNTLGTVAYIALVSLFVANIPNVIGTKDHTIFIPIAMLSLFVFSAALTASLVLGRPVLWYLDGKKKEAVKLFIQTLVCLFVTVLLTFIILAFINQ